MVQGVRKDDPTRMSVVLFNPNLQEFVWGTESGWSGFPLPIPYSGTITALGVFDDVNNHRVLPDKSFTLSVTSLDFSSDGQVLVSNDISDGGGVILWRYSDGKFIKSISEYEASCLDFSPDGQTLAVGSNNGIIRLWRAK